MTITYNSLEELPLVARKVVDFSNDRRIWLFEGQMGAGKTTLIKAICAEMEVTDVVSSPTFSLLNLYKTSSGSELCHFDFYRIKDQIEAIDIGCDEYFYSGNYCFIEWPEKIPSLIPDKFMKISINLGKENDREISLSIHE